jgi:hypothetical protein
MSDGPGKSLLAAGALFLLTAPLVKGADVARES